MLVSLLGEFVRLLRGRLWLYKQGLDIRISIVSLVGLGLLYSLSRRCGIERGSVAPMRVRATIIIWFIYQFNYVQLSSPSI
jgi:hypothetical protein